MNIQPSSAPVRTTAAPQATASQPPAGREAAVPAAPAANAAVAAAAAARAQAGRDAEPPAAPVDADTARQVARQINDYLKSSSANLEFQVDEESNQVVVRVVDTETKELIRQIPNETLLAISKSMDQLSGLLINQKA